MQIRAAVFGAGAIGTALGAYIARSGRQIDLISRNASHVAALKAGGARVSGEDSFTVNVGAMLPGEMPTGYDVVFIACKQTADGAGLEFLKDKLSANGVVCTLQNGLPERALAAIFGADRCFGCVVSWGATFKGGGETELTTPPANCFFDVDSRTPESIKQLLGCMGRVNAVENFAGVRWTKLIINSAFSSVSAATGLTFGQVAENKITRRFSQALFHEGALVARACGIRCAKIQNRDVVKIFDFKGAVKRAISLRLFPLMMKNHRALLSGMYFDLLRGRECEIEFISGEIARAAAECGVDVPATGYIIGLIHSIERNELKPSADNINLLKLK